MENLRILLNEMKDEYNSDNCISVCIECREVTKEEDLIYIGKDGNGFDSPAYDLYRCPHCGNVEEYNLCKPSWIEYKKIIKNKNIFLNR